MTPSKTLLTTLALLLILAGGLFVWQKQHLSLDFPSVPVEIPNAETPKDQQDISARYSQHIVPIEGTDEVWYQIPELGIQMRLNKQFAEDLVYEYEELDGSREQKTGAIYFSMRESVATNTTAHLIEEGSFFAAIGKINGHVKDERNLYIQSRYDSPQGKYQFKQFEEFFLFYQTPIDNGNVCSSINNEEDRVKYPNDFCIIFQTTTEL